MDVTTDPLFLGDPPTRGTDGRCSYCRHITHRLDGVAVTARIKHRFDRSPAGGYYSDELPAGAR